MNLRTRQMIIGLVMFFMFLFLSITVTIGLKGEPFYWLYKGFCFILEVYGIYLIGKSLTKD